MTAHDIRFGQLAELIGNSPHNLVSNRDRALLESHHIPEAIAVASVLNAHAGERWLDLGTGGGLPGLPLAIIFGQTQWTLVDATAKKVQAVDTFISELGLQNVGAWQGRAEHVAWEPELRGAFDGVISRAMAPMSTLAELARGFLRPGGTLAAVKGPTWSDELNKARRGLRLLSYEAPKSREVPDAPRPTWLVVAKAKGPPPDAYPRPDGIPKQNPL